MTSLAERVLEAIEAAEHTVTGRNQFGWLLDESLHTKHCGYRMGAYDDPCECPVGAAVLRRCAADRKIVAERTGARFTQECHPEYERNNGYVEALDFVLSALAEAYGVPLEQEET